MATTTVMTVPYDVPLPPSPPRSDHDELNPSYPHQPSFKQTGQPTPSASTSGPINDLSTMHHAHRYPPPSAQDRSRASQKSVAKLEDFELIHTLGKGCAGRVLLVKHTNTNAVHAMKAISKRSVLTHDELTHTMTEMSILRHFAIEEPDNPFIAKLHHSFTDRENFYLVMEFYPGGDLATQMEQDGILGHHRTRFYTADIVEGLEDLHRNGIIVRDLKPENVLLNSKGHAVLADFGLSKQFPYRGDPKPIHVVPYAGQPVVPEWAGMGMGSWRLQPDGSRRLTMDRAFSFVGTSEYLSPEVVERGEYSYAVDWWALGCIVLEGMIGRVPFRKEEDEPPIVLWNKILMDPWDELFKEPRMAKRPPSYFGLDPVTLHFIDSLLQKDPMWRLTEPFIKQHPYFAYIDWETVRRGEYEDPHGLQLHPTAEYNTRYFPRLCLEEPPSVDMTSHDDRNGGEESPKRTPLNDNQIYALEQAKYRKELEGFAWSRDWIEDDIGNGDEQGWEGEAEDELQSEDVEEEASSPRTFLNSPLIPSEELTEELDVKVAQKTPNREVVSAPAAAPLSTPRVDSGEPASPDLVPEKTAPPSVPYPSIRQTSPRSVQSLPLIPDTLPPHEFAPDTLPAYGAPGPDTLPSLVPAPVAQPRLITNRHSYHLDRPVNLPAGLPAGGLSVSDMISIPSPGIGSPTRVMRRHPRLPSEDTVPMARLSVELHGTITQLDDEEWEQLDGDGIEAPNGFGGQGPPSSFFSRNFVSVLKRRPSAMALSSLRRQTKNSDTSSSREPSPTKATRLFSPSANEGGNGGSVGIFSGKSIENTKKAFEKLKSFPRPGRKEITPSQPSTITPFILPPIEGLTLVTNPQPSRPPLLPHSITSPSLKSETREARPQLPKSKSVTKSNFFTRSVDAINGNGNGDNQSPEKKGRRTRSNKSNSPKMKKKSSQVSSSSSRSDSSDHLGTSVSGSLSTGGNTVPRVELTKTPPVVWEFEDKF